MLAREVCAWASVSDKVVVCLPVESESDLPKQIVRDASLAVVEAYFEDLNEIPALCQRALLSGDLMVLVTDGSAEAAATAINECSRALAEVDAPTRAVVTAPYEVLYRSEMSDIREAALGRVEAVITADREVLLGRSGQRGSAALIVLQGGRQPASVALWDAPGGLHDDYARDLRTLLESRGQPTKYGVRCRSIRRGREPWTLAFWAPGYASTARRLERIGDVVPLAAVVDVGAGQAPPVGYLEVGPCGSTLRLLDEGEEPSHQALGLFACPGTRAFEVQHVLAFLRSGKAEAQMDEISAPSAAARISQIAVPMPSKDLQEAIERLGSAAVRMRAWSEEAALLSGEFFSSDEIGEAERRVRRAALRLGQRYRAALSMESTAQRVVATFPSPLALAWYQMAESPQGSVERYVWLLECVEALVSFGAVVMAMVLRDNNVELGSLADLRNRCRSGHSLTLGDWLNVLREASSARTAKVLGAVHPLPDLDAVFEQYALEDKVRRIIERRNAQAHGRGPKGWEVEGECASLEQEVVEVFDALEGIAAYDLVRVERAWVDAYMDRCAYSYRALTGALPSGEEERATVVGEVLEEGSVYATDRAGHLHLLRPLFLVRICQECHGERGFLFDGLAENGAPRFTGVGHSHSQIVRGQTRALATLGWIDEQADTRDAA